MSPAPQKRGEGVGVRPLVAPWPPGLTPTSPQYSYTMTKPPEHGRGTQGLLLSASGPPLWFRSAIHRAELGVVFPDCRNLLSGPSLACTPLDSDTHVCLSPHRAWSCVENVWDWVSPEGSAPVTTAQTLPCRGVRRNSTLRSIMHQGTTTR